MLEIGTRTTQVPTSESWESTRVHSGLPWYWNIIALGIAVALVYSRQPSSIARPQFIIDDGRFFADAYNSGWFAALFQPYTGYFQTLPRLIAGLSLITPFKFAPLVFASVGLAVQVLPVFLLLSRRLSGLGSLPYRILLAAIYLALPNSAEINVTLTEAQWHLAIIALIVIIAREPETRSWWAFDYAALVLCASTGPFVIILLPLAVVYRWRAGRMLPSSAAVILAVGALIQILSLAMTGERLHGVPHGDPRHLIGILACQVYIGTTLGHNSLGAQLPTSALATIAGVGTSIVIWWWRDAEPEARFITLCAIVVLAFSVGAPIGQLPPGYISSWQLLAAAPGIRYWFFPTLGFAWVLASLFKNRHSEWKRIVGFALLLFMGLGVVRDWRIPAYADQGFEASAERFSRLRSGETMIIPQPDRYWTMILRHR